MSVENDRSASGNWQPENTSPEEIAKIKESILEQWRSLPIEEQGKVLFEQERIYFRKGRLKDVEAVDDSEDMYQLKQSIFSQWLSLPRDEQINVFAMQWIDGLAEDERGQALREAMYLHRQRLREQERLQGKGKPRK
jgi:hypothetical protein